MSYQVLIFQTLSYELLKMDFNPVVTLSTEANQRPFRQTMIAVIHAVWTSLPVLQKSLMSSEVGQRIMNTLRYASTGVDEPVGQHILKLFILEDILLKKSGKYWIFRLFHMISVHQLLWILRALLPTRSHTASRGITYLLLAESNDLFFQEWES
jgi:hypothetical protein